VTSAVSATVTAVASDPKVSMSFTLTGAACQHRPKFLTVLVGLGKTKPQFG
jgi:hypothetical protein